MEGIDSGPLLVFRKRYVPFKGAIWANPSGEPGASFLAGSAGGFAQGHFCISASCDQEQAALV
ncbi:MAG: hypothetical protein ACO3BO_06755, partial [Anaerohalosphaeraceae bacterium]